MHDVAVGFDLLTRCPSLTPPSSTRCGAVRWLPVVAILDSRFAGDGIAYKAELGAAFVLFVLEIERRAIVWARQMAVEPTKQLLPGSHLGHAFMLNCGENRRQSESSGEYRASVRSATHEQRGGSSEREFAPGVRRAIEFASALDLSEPRNTSIEMSIDAEGIPARERTRTPLITNRRQRGMTPAGRQ